MARNGVPKVASTGNLSHRAGLGAEQRSAAGDALRIPPDELLALFRATDLDTLIDGTFHVLDAAVECDYVSAIYRNAGDA